MKTTLIHGVLGGVKPAIWLFVFIFLFSFYKNVTAGVAELVVESVERERWYGEDNLYGENYGRRMAMDGDRMVSAGAYKAVVWNSSTSSQVLEPSIGMIEDVAIDGDWIIFGSPRDIYTLPTTRGGEVSVFNLTADGWIEVATWTEPDNSVTGGYEVHSFGSSVAIEGDTLLVSAPDSRECCEGDVDGPGFVFAYVWNGSQWVLTASMSADDANWQYFGASIAYEGGRLIVGAPKENSTGAGEYGAAYIFEGSGSNWNEEEQIDPIETPDDYSDNNFARHVANDNGELMIVAGDFGAKILEINQGRDGWDEYVADLPDRRISRTTDGVGIGYYSGALYIDDATDEVVVIHRINNVWVQRTDPLGSSLTSEPMGVSINDRKAAVGYPSEDTAGPNTGCVIDYRENSYVLVENQVLCHGDAVHGDFFGYNICAAPTGGGNGMAIVGAPGDTGFKGAAYLYTYNGQNDEWTKADRWHPEGLVADAGYGRAVACTGINHFAVGAANTVFVHHPDGGQRVLTGPGDEGFGNSLAYIGDTLIVGAPSASGYIGQYDGAVYIYKYDEAQGDWLALDRISPFDLSSPEARAGWSVAFDGQWLVFGAPGDNAAYVCDLYNGLCGSPQRLDTGSILPGDRFGEAVAVYGNKLFIGAPGDDGAANDGGAVHVFEWDGSGWNHIAKWMAADAGAENHFGNALYLDAKNLFIGAPGEENGDETAGSTYGGSTYPYRLFGGVWVSATERIMHHNPAQEDLAATSLAFVNNVQKDTLLVGATGLDDAAGDSGGVIVFDYSSRINVPSPLDPDGPGCQGDFEVDFDQEFVSPLDPAGEDSFGHKVDLAGDTLIVSEPMADFSYVNSHDNPVTARLGAVHVYRRTGINSWTLEQTLQPPIDDVVPILRISRFGLTAAVDGDWLVVGDAYGNKVWVYQRTSAGWLLHTHLLPVDAGRAFGSFGLDVSGDTIMVGESNYSIPSGDSGVGRVYFFEYDSAADAWGINGGAPIVCSEAHRHQNFGHSVAVDAYAGRAVATGDNQSDTDRMYRSAYVFERRGGLWQETAVLQGEPHGATQHFGWEALDISGDTVVVGDAIFTGPVSNNGAVFVWTHDGSGWTAPDILFGSQPGNQDAFGDSVAIDGNLLVVGATSAYDHYPHGSARPGVAYVFGRDSGGWTERLRILPADLNLYQFASRTAVSGGIVAAGTPRRPNTWDGTVYAYDMGCQSHCPGDFDNDGDVDGADLAVIVSEYGTTGCAASPCLGDIDRSGDVDQSDLDAFKADFGRKDCFN